MPVALHSICTAVPPYQIPQEVALRRMEDWLVDPKMRRQARLIYRRSGIENRYSVLPDFGSEGAACLFQRGKDSPGRPPSSERNRVYAEQVPHLLKQLGEELFAGGALDPESLTHVIYVTCTGFTNPGPELSFIQTFGLRPTIERTTLGFMGCYAAIPALRMARDIVQARPESKVLILCAEVCSVHLSADGSEDSLVADAIFADGAAAAVVSSRPPSQSRYFDLSGFFSQILPMGESDMAWDIGDQGFRIRLSSYVPAILRDCVPEYLDGLQADRWAVHPGGRAILDQLGGALQLPANALDISRSILREYGNMSSATILFVLQRMLKECAADARVSALAFGPGLTLEVANMVARLGESHGHG